jgi:hypothetical protein
MHFAQTINTIQARRRPPKKTRDAAFSFFPLLLSDALSVSNKISIQIFSTKFILSKYLSSLFLLDLFPNFGTQKIRRSGAKKAFIFILFFEKL